MVSRETGYRIEQGVALNVVLCEAWCCVKCVVALHKTWNRAEHGGSPGSWSRRLHGTSSLVRRRVANIERTDAASLEHHVAWSVESPRSHGGTLGGNGPNTEDSIDSRTCCCSSS